MARTGSLAARSLLLLASGTAVVAAVLAVGAWWLGARLLEDARTAAGEQAARQADPSVVPAGAGFEAAEFDLTLLLWLLIGGSVLVMGVGVATAWLVLRRNVLAPVRQL